MPLIPPMIVVQPNRVEKRSLLLAVRG